MKAGDKVKFVGVPCARIEEVGIKFGDILTLEKMLFKNPPRWSCVGCDMLFIEGDFEPVKKN